MVSILIFIVGCFFGSFLNLLIDRLPKGENVVSGRSHCDSCGKVLGILDLIPIISYLFLRGKCRYCHAPFSNFYPFMEIFTGLVFIFSYFWVINNFQFSVFSFQFWITFTYYLAVFSSLIVIFFTDLRSGIIPNQILIFILIITAPYQLYFGSSDLPIHLLSAFISLAIFMALFLITKGRGMGFGDVKFSFLLGFLLGFPNFILALYVAFLTGAITSIILILWGKKRLHKDTIAFGPFMVLGVLVALFFGETIIPKLLPFLAP